MTLWSRFMDSANAFLAAWRVGRDPEPIVLRQGRFHELWSYYDGTAFTQRPLLPAVAKDPQLYSNIRLLYSHVEPVVDFYAATIYQGALSTDGQPLPDGAPNAIPIDPQTGDEATDAALRLGISNLWNAWNWQQFMSLRPTFGACLGSYLVELVDDQERRMVWPVHVWPGYVKHIALDHVGNVRAYTLEYRVDEPEVTRYGETTPAQHYTFRKEVDGEAIRYFKDDKPFDAYGDGDVVENIYGFAPAVWDRHRIIPGDYGAAAIEGTVGQLRQLNSFFSRAFDYQAKGFGAPLIVRGARVVGRGQDVLKLAGPPKSDPANPEADVAAQADWLNVVETSADGGIEQLTFDVGQALALVEFVKTGILAANPEAQFWNELRQMSQLTGPGAEIALGDAVSRAKRARANYDAQTVKLHQMALAMAGERLRRGDWGSVAGDRRREAWRPFNLASYDAGLLDHVIADRPVILDTEEERINLVILRKSLGADRQALIEAGYSDKPGAAGEPSEVDRIAAERAGAQQSATDSFAAAFNAA